MRYVFDISDNDDYKISGYFDEKVIKELKQAFKGTEAKRNSVIISGDFEPIEIFQVFMSANDIDITYNFIDYNDFISSKVLEQLFKIAYTDKEFSASEINTVQSALAQRAKQLPVNAGTFPEIQLEDAYFERCIDEIAGKYSKRNNAIDWFSFYRYIEDKVGNRESLRYIVKILFMINFSKNVSKSYVAFVLSKFNFTTSSSNTNMNQQLIDRLEVLTELEKLNKKKSSSPSILVQRSKDREKLKKLLRAIGASPPTSRKSDKKIYYRVKNGRVIADLSSSSSDSDSSSD